MNVKGVGVFVYRLVLMITLILAPVFESAMVVRSVYEVTDNVRHNLVLSLIQDRISVFCDGSIMCFENYFRSYEPTCITFELGAKILGGFVVVARRTTSQEIMQKLCGFIRVKIPDYMPITVETALFCLEDHQHHIVLHQLAVFLEKEQPAESKALGIYTTILQSVYTWAFGSTEPTVPAVDANKMLADTLVRNDFESLRAQLNNYDYNNYHQQTFENISWNLAAECIREIAVQTA